MRNQENQESRWQGARSFQARVSFWLKEWWGSHSPLRSEIGGWVWTLLPAQAWGTLAHILWVPLPEGQGHGRAGSWIIRVRPKLQELRKPRGNWWDWPCHGKVPSHLHSLSMAAVKMAPSIRCGGHVSLVDWLPWEHIMDLCWALHFTVRLRFEDLIQRP